MITYSGYTESPAKIAARLARWDAKHKQIMAEKAAKQTEVNKPNLAVALQ